MLLDIYFFLFKKKSFITFLLFYYLRINIEYRLLIYFLFITNIVATLQGGKEWTRRSFCGL